MYKSYLSVYNSKLHRYAQWSRLCHARLSCPVYGNSISS